MRFRTVVKSCCCNNSRWCGLLAFALAGLLLSAGVATGQNAGGNANAQAGADAAVATPDLNEMISLNLPGDVPLDMLISLVSDQLKVKILHDERIAGKKVAIKLPSKIPRGSLMGLLESALKLKGFALVQGDQPGWYRVDEARQLTSIAPAMSQTGPLSQVDAVQAITQVFPLFNADAKRADQIVRPFLSQPGGNCIVIDEQDALVVTDYVPNMKRIEELIQLLDRPSKETEVRFIKLEHIDATMAASQLGRLLAVQGKMAGQMRPGDRPVDVVDDPRGNRLMLVGYPDELENAVELVQKMDVPLGLETHIYHFSIASPKQVDTLTKSLIGDIKLKTVYKSAVDEKAGLLVVTTTPEIHEQIKSLENQLDTTLESTSPKIEFYKLQNAKVLDVLETLRDIEGSFGTKLLTAQGLGADSPPGSPPGSSAPGNPAIPGGPGGPGDIAPPGAHGVPPTGDPTAPGSGVVRIEGESSYGMKTEEASVVADPNTNTLIVVADPAVQQRYATLIEKLDRRRPQVLIEVTFVTLDDSNSLALGVEISRSIDGSDYTMLNFSSFGLSEVNPDTGALTIKPGLGYNGAVVSTDIANIIVRALATQGKGQIESAPKILVNDNATGSLDSSTDSPFTSVNASTTVATTSFGGYESAGTTIEVTPHISEGEHLNLEYKISLSSFGSSSSSGSGGSSNDNSATVPPPRQRNDVSSEVTVPDGYTVIVGGLKRHDYTETVQKVPLLGDIPGLGELFKSTSKNNRSSILFIFIRPVILRDDQFNDLKYLSDRQLKDAGMKDNFPQSEPLLVR